MSKTTDGYMLVLTAQIVTAHVENNQVAEDAFPDLIKAVYRSLAIVGSSKTERMEPQIPAVSVKRSVFPDFIICLEDGMKLQTLKRHLKTSHGISPADYRAKWGLPQNYPMVAPNYAATRSGLAKSIGLGRSPAINVSELQPLEVEAPDVTQVPARRARGSRG